VPAPDSSEVDSAAAPAFFACEPGGATEEVEFGCRLLARPTVERFPTGPVHWHLARYATREQAQVAGRFSDIVTEVGGEVWLHRFGPESDVPRAGTRTATVGPLPIPRAAAYQIDVFYAVLPAGARTAALTHPGPAAWYVLEGEQCVETSKGVVQATVGEGAVAPPAGTPLQWVNTGAESERALFVLVRDVGRNRATPSKWKPKGACDAPPG
jgi:quercetin dioxygenase-like cupin family protein